MAPSLSVVLPVFNGMPYLELAVGSILSQTFTDFEFVILDNGSTDGSVQLLEGFAEQDARVRLFVEPRPLGMVGSSNAAVAKSSGALVARMDADDLSRPQRLERQVDVLSRRPDAALVGVLGDAIDGFGRRAKPRDRSRLFGSNSLAPCDHGSIMFRREIFDRVGGYREGTEGFEDQDLYRRITKHGKLLVLTELLYSYRFHLSNWTTALLDRWEGGAFRQLAAQRIWAGVRAPRLEVGAIRGHPPGAALQSLIYGTWGHLSPRSLRRILQFFVVLRDRRAALRLTRSGRQDPYEWSFAHGVHLDDWGEG